MNKSRILGIVGGVAALLSALGATLNFINPKLGATLAGAGGLIAMLTERAQGGVSKPDMRAAAAGHQRRQEAARSTKNRSN